MADNVVDMLAIEIEANAMQSVDGVKRLSRALSSLAKSVSKVNGAGINNVSASIKVMNTATGTAAQNMDKSSKGTKRFGTSLGLLNGSMKRSNSGMKSLAYHFGKFYANCFLAIRGAKAFGSAVESTMDYIEAFNFFDVATNSATSKDWKEYGYDSAEEYATSFKQGLADLNEKMTGFKTDVDTGDITPSSMENLGIDITQLTTFQSEIVSITSSLGLMSKTSFDAASGLSRLTADMSSLHNIDLSTVMTNFQSGLIGQSRALYKYGIDITNATLQTYAYNNGISKSVSEMTQAEKMQLRMLAILDQSKNSWGDLANTINQPANQLRVLKNGFKNLAITIGKLFMPVVSSILPYLNAMVKSLQYLFTWLAKVAGVDLKVDNSGSGVSSVVDDMEDLEDSADNANTAAKKLQNTIYGFDEINKRDSDSSSNTSSGGGAGAGVDLSDAISSALAEYEAAWEAAYANMQDKSTKMANAIVKAFQDGDYEAIGTYISTGLTSALNGIKWKKIYEVAKNFGSGFASFLNGLITPGLFDAFGKTIASTLNTGIYAALAFGEELEWEQMGEAIGTGVNSFFTTFDFKALARTLNTWVDGLETMIGEALETISWSEVLSGLTDFLGNLEFDTVAVIIGTLTVKKIGKVAIASAIKGYLGGNISAALASFGIGSISLPTLLVNFAGFAVGPSGMGTAGFDTIANWVLAGIDGALTNLLPTWLSTFIGEFVEGGTIGGVIGSWLPGIGTAIGAALGGLVVSAPIKIDFGEMFNFSWATQWFDDAKKAFETAFDGKRDGIMDIGGWILEGIMDGFVGALSFIVQPIADFFTQIWDGICKAFGIHSPAKKMKPIGKNILLGVVEGFTGAISSFTTAISNFFTNNVKPLFSAKKWKTNIGSVKTALSDRWSSAKKWWDDNKPSLKEVKAGYEDFKSKLSEGWNSAKSWWNENKPTLKKVTTTYENFKSKISERWNSAKTWWNENKPSLKEVKATYESFKSKIVEKWNSAKTWWNEDRPKLADITAGIADLKKKLSDAWEGVKSWWNNNKPNLSDISANIKLPHIKVEWDTDGFAAKALQKLGLKGFPDFGVEYYAKGGFPSQGDLFVANEHGAELVGGMNGKTTVANQNEIADGFASAIYPSMYSAVKNAMAGSGNNNQPIVVENTIMADTEVLYQKTEQGRKKSERRYGTTVSLA